MRYPHVRVRRTNSTLVELALNLVVGVITSMMLVVLIVQLSSAISSIKKVDFSWYVASI